MASAQDAGNGWHDRSIRVDRIDRG